jgi:hypothetical protein
MSLLWVRIIFESGIYMGEYANHIKESGELSRYSDRLGAGRPGFDSRLGEDFSFLHSVQTGSGVHPAPYRMGTGDSFPGGKADHSPPSSAEVKNGGALTPLPIRPHGLVLN